MLGRTVDEGRVRDVAATARYLRETYGKRVTVIGKAGAGLIGAYAALLEPEIEASLCRLATASHMADKSPRLLNVLRVLDVPESWECSPRGQLNLFEADPALVDGCRRSTSGPVRRGR